MNKPEPTPKLDNLAEYAGRCLMFEALLRRRVETCVAQESVVVIFKNADDAKDFHDIVRKVRKA